MKQKKWNVLGLGLAMSATWGIGTLALGIIATKWGYGTPIVELLSSIYKGYDTSFSGTLTGTIWALIDGFIGGTLVAWFYNYFSK